VCIEDDEDPTARLLAGGLEPVLKTIVSATGPDRHPHVHVAFQDLSYHATMFKGSNVIASYGNRLAHFLTFCHRYRGETRDVLRSLTGSFRAGKLTLLLGPPQSGKSSLIKAIAGRLAQGPYAHLTGSITFGGHTADRLGSGDTRILLPKLVGYVEQEDVHFPPLTVLQTIRFAHECTSKVDREKFVEDGLEGEQLEQLLQIDALYPSVVMEVCGIRHIANTPVAAISAGQRKRLTVAEVAIARTPVMLADEISTGLDSATTYDICNVMRISAHTRRRTIVLSLVHLTQESFELFDEVTLMCEGQIAFQGPREAAVPYFEALGLRCPPGMSHCDFLMDVTLPGRFVEFQRGPPDTEAPGTPILKPVDMGNLWKSSEQYRQRLEEDGERLRESAADFDVLPTRGYYHHKLTSRHIAPFYTGVKLCVPHDSSSEIHGC